MKILSLGNEFIAEDSFAKKVCNGMDIINVKGSFELMDLLRGGDEIIIIDVVKGLNHVALIRKEDLRQDSILSAHDFDAGFLIGLIDPNVRIIGVPENGDLNKIREEVQSTLNPVNFKEMSRA